MKKNEDLLVCFTKTCLEKTWSSITLSFYLLMKPNAIKLVVSEQNFCRSFFLWCNSATTNICSIILNISNHLYVFFGLNHIMIFHPSKFRKCGQKNKRLIFVLFPNGVQKFSSILNIRFFKVFTFFAKDKYVREQKKKRNFFGEKKSERCCTLPCPRNLKFGFFKGYQWRRKWRVQTTVKGSLINNKFPPLFERDDLLK